MRRRSPPGQSGFTLLELLIALVLMGMILTLLFGGLRLGARSWDSGEKRVDSAAQLRAIQGFVRRELSQVFPFRWKIETESRLAFFGTPEAVRFVAPLPPQVSGGGLYLIGLELEQGTDGRRLVMKRTWPGPETKDFSALEEGDKSVLVEHVEGMSFSYFGAEKADGEPNWMEKWDDPQRLPLLIRLQLKLTDGSEWPYLAVPLVVSAESACIWDSVRQRCVNH